MKKSLYAHQAFLSLTHLGDVALRVLHAPHEGLDSILPRLRDAQHVVLPVGGKSIDMKKGAIVPGVPIGAFALPFPDMTFEYRVDPLLYTQTTAALLAYDKVVITAHQFEPESWIEMFQVYHAKGQRKPFEWLTVPTMVRVRPAVPGQPGMTVQYQEIAKGTQSPAEGLENDWEYEVALIMMFLLAMSCDNVRLDRKRVMGVKRKLLPAYLNRQYHIVRLPGQADDPDPFLTRSQPLERHRARQHWRRGHIRHLPGGNTWVRAHIVNRDVDAQVEKHYETKQQPPDP